MSKWSQMPIGRIFIRCFPKIFLVQQSPIIASPSVVTCIIHRLFWTSTRRLWHSTWMEQWLSSSHNPPRFFLTFFVFEIGLHFNNFEPHQESLNEMLRFLTHPDKKNLLNDILTKAFSTLSVSSAHRDGWQYLYEVGQFVEG